LKSFHLWIFNDFLNRNRLDKLGRSCHGNKKGGELKILGFLSSNFMKLCRNIHRSVWQLLRGWNKFLLAYLVPLDVDVVPMKFYQFLLVE
jgi:hypothetical protein